jgi:integrating conjugative element protein (TIGR03749 family)
MKVLLGVSLMMVLALPCFSSLASTPRAMEWRGVPLSITLTPEQETILHLGADVRVATPAHLGSSLRVSSLAGRVYLTASEPFDAARLQIMRLSDGMRLLLDVSAKVGAATPPQIDILLPGTANEQNLSAGEENVSERDAHLAHLRMAPEALLVRYAMQSLYSPSHALEPLPGVVRSPMGLPEDIQANAFSKWRVRAKPIAAWQLGEQVVTAVSLTNQTERREALDPRLVTLGGQCLLSRCAVSFSHPELGAADSATKQATAFIVTKGPLADNLLPSAH